MKWAKPQEWNIGAAIIVRSRARSGIRENIAASGLRVSGWPRWAPFGIPVVPEVRITNRLDSSGGSRSESSVEAISSSRPGSPLDPSSRQATKRRSSAPASASSPANSSS